MPDSDVAQTGPTFEVSLTQLQQIVAELEDGSAGLEHSLLRFEEGMRLLRGCYRILENAEQRIELLVRIDPEGNPVTTPFDATATAESADKTQKKPSRRRSAAPAKEAPTGAPLETPPDNAASDEQFLF